ncbi:hypothetical protein HPP92_028904 [Vanilla planifolia]|uniref:Uncharacterized protein n=1 Tax=Vanilla planifolia TaxID=51239 RepID=A0A835P965_VANPL|nr:hypothetical protein HPP92_028904 [Vanilla planifolia]KAG0446307.1 hypothetical protein HPP92_028894 [Vanilla planifolia]
MDRMGVLLKYGGFQRSKLRSAGAAGGWMTILAREEGDVFKTMGVASRFKA